MGALMEDVGPESPAKLQVMFVFVREVNEAKTVYIRRSIFRFQVLRIHRSRYRQYKYRADSINTGQTVQLV